MSDDSLTDDLAKALRDSLYLPPGASDCLLIDRVREINEQLKAAKIEVYDLRKECQRIREDEKRTDAGARTMDSVNRQLNHENHKLAAENARLTEELSRVRKAAAEMADYLTRISEHAGSAKNWYENHCKEET